jgi:hypothetical protein
MIGRVLRNKCERETVVLHLQDGSQELLPLEWLRGVPDPETGEYLPNRLTTGTILVLKHLMETSLI